MAKMDDLAKVRSQKFIHLYDEGAEHWAAAHGGVVVCGWGW
jgi:hypothetical protein